MLLKGTSPNSGSMLERGQDGTVKTPEAFGAGFTACTHGLQVQEAHQWIFLKPDVFKIME